MWILKYQINKKNNEIILLVGGWKSLSHSFNKFVQTAESFRNKSSHCLYESFTKIICLRSQINAIVKHCLKICNGSAVALFGTIFIGQIQQKQLILCQKCNSLNINLIDLYTTLHLCYNIVQLFWSFSGVSTTFSTENVNKQCDC